MRDKEYLEQKRLDVLKAIKPICEAFQIKNYDYIIEDDLKERISLNNEVKIGCSGNSIDTIITELVGYIFILHWSKRSLGAFDKQTRNVIMEYWRWIE